MQFGKVETVDSILKVHADTIVKLEARESVLEVESNALRLQELEIMERRRLVDKEANRGRRAISFFNKMFEEIDEED